MHLCSVCDSDPRYIVECELCARCLCLACSRLSQQEVDVLLEDTRRLLYFCQECKAKIPNLRNQLGLDPENVPPRSESPPAANNSVLPEVREQLAHILTSLSNRHTNHQDALAKLLDIKERYPETDVWSCMQGSSFHFRSYVERGLAEAAERRRFPRLSTHHHSIDNENENENDNETEEDENMHMVYMNRLWKLQAKAGMPLSQPSFLAPPAGGDSALSDPAPLATRSHNIHPQFELRTTAASNCPSEQANVEALRLKLQQIKNASRR